MDTEELLAHSRTRFDHAASKRILKEKYQGKFILAYGGGMFKASTELISFLDACVKLNNHSETDVVLLDLYENPVKVNIIELRKIVYQKYTEQMSAWLNEYTELSKNR
jgi:hypothetical protein